MKYFKMKTLLILVVIVIVYIAGGILLAYHKEPKLSKEDQHKLRKKTEWKERHAQERAAIIEHNKDALFERVRMINHAKKEVIISTFAFHSDESGKIILGALLAAADRDVKVKLLADGFESILSMERNPYFYALSSHKNVQIKLYNKVNPLLPWKIMGRLHDKYMIVDEKAYLLGGRNIFDCFLGDYTKKSNYDRDVLVYCKSPDKDSSIQQLKQYFQYVWNQKESKLFHNKSNLAERKSVKVANEELKKIFQEFSIKNTTELQSIDYESMTYPVSHIMFFTNPVTYQSKKPVVWYQLCELMNRAQKKVDFHTPYMICNDMMYDSLKKISENGKDISIMTNSPANNGNPFGSSDFLKNKDKILDLGWNIWEYEGGNSYHGKSILIDDNISVVGSFNMDMRSAYLDTEIMLVIDSTEINRELTTIMQTYEKDSRKANKDGSYTNPYHVIPVKMSKKKEDKVNFVKNYLNWARFLF